jgi:hypothetical protein
MIRVLGLTQITQLRAQLEDGRPAGQLEVETERGPLGTAQRTY